MKAVDFNREIFEKGGWPFKLILRYANHLRRWSNNMQRVIASILVEERMCRWILLTQDRVKRNAFPLTQDYLAQMLGVHRPTVSAVANRLKQEGLINYTRGSITVTARNVWRNAAANVTRSFGIRSNKL